MDPFAELDAFAGLIAEAVADALIRTAFIAGCVGLSAACLAALVLRRARRERR